MLKPPITLPIGRSKYGLLLQCGLLMGIVALTYWVVSKPAAVAVALLGCAIAWRGYYHQPKGVLVLTLAASQVQGYWQRKRSPVRGALTHGEKVGEAAPVRCDYLGPWLIGLHVGKQRIWLWPDSAPRQNLREVRRLFHPPGR